MKRIKVTEGDIILIPTRTGDYGVAKVIFASHHWRNVILLGIYKAVVSKIETPASLPEVFATSCVFTGSQRIKLGEWPIVARTRVTDSEKEMTRYFDSDDVWIGDQRLGKASPEEKKRLPLLSPLHCEDVVDQVEAVVASIRGSA